MATGAAMQIEGPPGTVRPARADRLAGLEALRAIAAISVMGLHIPAIFGGLPKPFSKGYLGVDLFFILSGFVMVRGFERKMIAGAIRPLPFLRDRAMRMMPVMAVGGLIALPDLWARVADHGTAALIAGLNLALLPVWWGTESYPLNVPAWTVFFILLGNFLHALGLYRLDAKGLGLAIAISLMAAVWLAASKGTLDLGARPQNFLFGLPRLLLGYLIGMALARWWRHEPVIPVPPPFALLAMPVLCLLAWWLKARWMALSGWPFDIAFVVIACPLMIAGAMRLQHGGAIAAFSGAWSFPLYAVHFPLLVLTRNLGFSWPAGAVLALAISLAVTWGEAWIRARPRTQITLR